MRAGGIHHAELILLLLLFLVGALTTLSRRFQTPYPIVLVIDGLLLSFIPNLPQISLNPYIVFLVLLAKMRYEDRISITSCVSWSGNWICWIHDSADSGRQAHLSKESGSRYIEVDGN